MVLFKRKPVQYMPRPKIEDDSTDCWLIPETQELFLSYESYLQRMDWYKARKFICEISGHSGLSFFEALKSETAGARDVENAFPEPLKQPVLRKIQFSIVSRIDNLVDQVYDEFKNDYFPKEQVVVNKNGERMSGTIREKATFAELKNPDTGEVTREAFTRYLVNMDEGEEAEMLADDLEVSRDRKAFTKQMLRSFIKNSVTREAWTGAPWLVKDNIAQFYQIDTSVPLHLQHSYKIAEKKERKKAEQQDGMFAIWPSNKLPELKPATKGRRSLQHMNQEQYHAQNEARFAEWSQLMQQDPAYAQQYQQYYAQHSPPPGYTNGYPWPQSHAHYTFGDGQSMPYPPPIPVPSKQPHKSQPAPPPIKYPIEDMDCPPLRDGVQRPSLKFAAKTQLNLEDGVDTTMPEHVILGLGEKNIGLLLETWNTLNVYCQDLHLDSFTFDDFVEALQWSSPDIECDLLAEPHCALLKMLVNDEKSGGAIQISLPDLPEVADSDDEEVEEESHVTTPEPEPEPDVPARRTRSRLSEMALAEQEKEEHAESIQSEQIPHRAAELFTEDYGWVERLRKRDFLHGGWQMILTGLLHQVAGRPRLKETCDRILSHLVPLQTDPTIETVLTQYCSMDINLRVEALQIVCQLFLETKAVKKFLEEMSATMTTYRKKKIEHQRRRKESIAILKKLHDERRILAPQELSPEPEELEELQEVEKMIDDTTEIVDSEDESRITSTRSLRRAGDRAAERKRKRDEEAERKKKEQEEKASKGSKEYQKILKAIEKEREKIAAEEEQIDIVDGDLREADAYRTRCLGKDRFCNRYWWFERNAMPYGGLPDSSTADAQYANGRLWVQGPDDMEREGYIDVPDEARNNYHRCFQMTPAERKALEEGPTNLHRAYQWGFFDEGDSIDKLIEWLDGRGVRELKLKKELTLQRDVMAKHMLNRLRYVNPERAKEIEQEKATNGTSTEDPESEDEKIIPATTRMSTRMKSHNAEVEDLEKVHRCLRWKNIDAINHQGHRHVDPPPAPIGKAKKPAAKTKGVAEIINVPRASRSSAGARKSEEPVVLNSGRQRKPTTRF